MCSGPFPSHIHTPTCLHAFKPCASLLYYIAGGAVCLKHIFFIWNFCLITVVPIPLPMDSQTTIKPLVKLTKEIASKYFFKDFCVSIITDDLEAGTINVILQELPTVLVLFPPPEDEISVSSSKKFDNLKSHNITFDKQLVEMMNLGCASYITQVNDPVNLVRYLHRASQRTNQHFNKRFLYLPPSTQTEVKVDIEQFFAMKEMDITPDVIFVRDMTVNSSHPLCGKQRGNSWKYLNSLTTITDCDNNKESTNVSVHSVEQNDMLHQKGNIIDMFELLTHRFVGRDAHKVLTLDRWVSSDTAGFQNSIPLYQNKIQNLQGKVLNISTVMYPPYTIIDTTATPPLYDGIELRFIKEFAAQLNFTFHIIMDDVNLWGEIWSNGTGNGMYGNVAMDVSVIGFGATYAWLPNYPYIDYSFPYFRSSVRCLAPKPKKLPGWMTPILPFSNNMWIAVGISFVFGVIVLQLFIFAALFLLGSKEKSRYSALSYTILWSTGMLLLQAPPENDNVLQQHNIPLRHIISWLMVYFLLISSIYNGGLASILTIPSFEHPIDTVEDLANSGMTWAATHEAWIYSIQDATEPTLVIITHNFQVLSEKELLKRTSTDDVAFAVERLLGGHYALPQYININTMPHLRASHEDIYSGFPVFNVRKGSPFLEKLNALILRTQAAGILSNYEEQVVREFLSQRLQLMVDQSYATTDGNGPVVLQFEHIQGAVFILLFGLLTALFVFIMESLWHNFSAQSRKCK